jgi:pSer/pThr/pTyr-binding forkhead associated (FHA) protein
MNERAQELFRQACRLGSPLALECEVPDGSTDVANARSFDCPFVLVGRDPSCDLVLPDKQVSKRHAFLQAVAGQVFVFDLKSRTQIQWEGEDASRPQGWLDEGRSITIGPYRIRRSGTADVADQYAEGCVAASHEQCAPADSDSSPTAALELPIRMANCASLWPIVGRIALAGRAEPCHLVLADESVSRFHAALVRTPMGIWVVDLLAREGTHVNGERVRWAWLADGDTLRMGSFTFIVRYETTPARICRQDVPLEAGAAPVAVTRTELAIPARHSEENPGALVVPFPGRSPTFLKAVTSTPQTFVPTGSEAWEQAVPYPQNAMAMWQRQMQMMESFHNDMIMMVQMFFAMHREHLASARDELDRVEQLTRELSLLQAKLAATPGSQKAVTTPPVDRTSRQARPSQLGDRKKREQPGVPDQPSELGRRHQPKSPKPAGAPRQAGRQNLAARSPASPIADGLSAVDDAQLHARLSQRITELQRERQGYWEKIMSKMTI